MKYKFPISVVMPCHNYGRYVPAAIDSMLGQGFGDFELIIVNDGSTDNSHEQILQYSDKRIRYLRLPAQTGNYPARNAGMRMAQGKYICVMDADDIAYPDRLQTQFDFLERHPGIGATGGQAIVIDETGRDTGRGISRPVCTSRRLKTFFLINNFVLHPSLMFRRRILEEHHLYYDERYRYSSDYDFVCRWADVSRVVNLDQLLLQYRQHSQQISAATFAEQTRFANEIRLKLLKRLVPNPLPEEITAFQLIMTQGDLKDPGDLNAGLILFNKLLEHNRRTRTYPQGELYNLLDFALSRVAGNVQSA